MNEIRDLPTRIPIFPLTGALLLPVGRLPLNIFEPRYVAMVEDAIKGDRIIGMIQPQEPDAEARVEEPPVYGVGCAGRITTFRETRDDRFEIVLDGISRFEIVREVEGGRGYRMAEVRWQNFAADLTEETAEETFNSPVREKLLGALEKFLTGRGASLNGTGIAELPDRELVAAIAMSCPFAPSEKQALLEAEGPADRAECLVSLLEMAAFEGEGRRLPRQ
jgi:hypothetical protein